MCGIAGIVGKRDPATDAHTIEQMMAVLRHRGPDDSGSWTHDEISLVHTRLSIIDLSGSQQPMATADGRWHLVFNGEIFNYRQLRNELNYPFRTGGDTEVLLAGIAQHGIGFVSRLVGQFSFAATMVAAEQHTSCAIASGYYRCTTCPPLAG